MSAVPLSEVIAALRDASSSAFYDDYTELADRIEQHGVAPPDGWVLVPKEPVMFAKMSHDGRSFSISTYDESNNSGYLPLYAASPEMPK